MNSMRAYFKGQAARTADKPMMYFDWEKAAEILRDGNVVEAYAGLQNDMEWTGGKIWKDGKPYLVDEDGSKPYTFLGSFWATPILVVTDEDGFDKEIECFVVGEEHGYSTSTFWPEEALTFATLEPIKAT